VEHLADARRLGVRVLPPDINAGEVDFSVEGGQIHFGLIAIKGLGRGAALDVVRTRREGGPYRDLFDFCERIDLRVVSRAAIERLIKAGALDHFGRRAQLMHVLPRALQAAVERQQDRRQGQKGLFESSDTAGEEATAEALPDIPEWSDSEKLKNEKEALDFYFSSHPLTEHHKTIEQFASHTVSQLAELVPNQEVVLGGILTQIRYMNTKKARNGNSRYVRCKLEDFTGAAECVLWPDDYLRCKDEVCEDRVCFVKATVERTREEPGLVISRILNIEQAERELTRALHLLLNLGVNTPTDIDAISRVLRRVPGPCPVYLTVRDGAGKKTMLKLDEGYRINPATFPVGEMETILGPGRVRFSGSAHGSARNGK
jgi:DNA polymerase-3 subunit alpha